MTDTTGPLNTLPGAQHALPAGARCDDHPEIEAVARVQGETDSMGAELHDLCQVCVDRLKTRNRWRGICEWCLHLATDLRFRRDYEEGMSGPVYEVCGSCVSEENQRAHEYLDGACDNFDCGEGWL